MPKRWRKITYKIIDSDNISTRPAATAVLATKQTEKMMNLRENDEKCFMSNNRKYICFWVRDNGKNRGKCVQKIWWESVSRNETKKLLANDITIHSFFYALCKGHLFCFICFIFSPLVCTFFSFLRFRLVIFFRFFYSSFGLFFSGTCSCLRRLCAFDFDCCW